MSRGWGSYESGLTVAGQPCRCSHAPGAVVTAITQHEEPCPDAHARPGAVEVAHSCTPHISRNRGIMRNSNVSNGHGPAPMCADPPHRTWEPDRHTRRSPDNPVIPTKTSPRPAEAPVSHVQHRRQPRPTPRSVHFRLEIGPGQPGQPDVEARTANSGTKAACRTSEPLASSRSAVAQPISMRKRTDFGRDCDRSRCGSGPISARVTTDLEPGYDRSRGGRRCRRLPVVVGGAGHGPVGRRQRRSIEHGDLFEAQALVEAP